MLTKIPNEISFLFLGGAKRVSMARKFADAARRRGLTARFFSYELSPYVPVAEVAEIVVGKRWTDPEILTDIHRVIEEKKIDIIIPFVDPAVEIAACVRDRYGDVWTPVGDAAKVSVMFDKVAADALFRRESLPVPLQSRYPMIAKPRFGSASKGIRIINTPEEMNSFNPDPKDYLIQEYIADNQETTVDCYVTLAGQIIAMVPRLRLETQGGEAAVTSTYKDERVEVLVAEVLRKTDLRGAVTVQLIRDLNSDNLYIMEINPRLGGGAVCAVHAGADLPGFIIDDCLGNELTPCNDWRDRTLVTRYFAEVAFTL